MVIPGADEWGFLYISTRFPNRKPVNIINSVIEHFSKIPKDFICIIGIAPITQVTHVRYKIVTFKVVNLM